MKLPLVSLAVLVFAACAVTQAQSLSFDNTFLNDNIHDDDTFDDGTQIIS